MIQNTTVVYGCIKDSLFGNSADEQRCHRRINHLVLNALPSVELFAAAALNQQPLLSREMFGQTTHRSDFINGQADIIHFGASYDGIEYEWESWKNHFEKLLNDMYWVSATVHLETEFNGIHTFTWEAYNDAHEPNSGEFSCRCEWTREAAFG